MSNFIVNQNHPLINREQTYLLDRKIVSIHSEDRDISQWPNSNNFEVTLPETLINIQSMRMINTSFPSNQYVFTTNYQNTKFMFDLSGTIYTATINEGFYEPEQFALELTNSMNEAVASVHPGYNHFLVKYNKVQHKVYIGNDIDTFILNFSTQIIYDVSCGQPTVWNNYIKWGLPYYLGYKKEIYIPQEISGSFMFNYEASPWLIVDPSSGSGMVYVSEPPCPVNLFGENAMYVELEKYNSMDEIDPYSENTNAAYNNDYHGRTNSAFIKIPLHQFPFSQIYDSRNAFLTNIKVFNPPLPKLRKMKFKIRYHDGRLVDFRCMPFSFSIEVNQLLDEQRREYIVRVPYMYTL